MRLIQLHSMHGVEGCNRLRRATPPYRTRELLTGQRKNRIFQNNHCAFEALWM
jgi:hypothetical protein